MRQFCEVRLQRAREHLSLMLLDLQKRQWIISAPPSSNCIYNDVYSLSLSALPLKAPGGPVWCSCAAENIASRVDLRLHRFHDRACSLCGPLRTECHNAIVARLHLFLESVLPDVHIIREPRIIDPLLTDSERSAGGLPDEHRPDLQIQYHGVVLYTDVSVVDPAASKYIVRHQSHLIEGAAATAQETVKKDKYGHLCRDNFMAGKFYPFVLEATGRLGNDARLFLREIAKLSRETSATSIGPTLEWDAADMHESGATDQERFLIHDITVINAKYGSRMTKRVLNHVFRQYSEEAGGALASEQRY